MTITAKQIVLNKDTVDKSGFDLSENGSFRTETFQVDENKLAEGEVLTKTIYLSNDPAQKFWIISADKNYSAGTPVGAKIPALGLFKIVKSNDSRIKEGDIYSGKIGWADYSVVKADDLLNPVNFFSKKDPSVVPKLWWYLSLLGMSSLTAYVIFYETLGLKDETDAQFQNKVFLINGAAGSVGNISVQLAANVFKASKVVAVVGGPEKVKYVESLGKQVVGVDYKKDTYTEDLLKATGGQTVDYFVDNVGGEFLDFAIGKLLKVHATVACCGGISAYNDPSKAVVKNSLAIVTKRLTIKGLLVSDHAAVLGQGAQKLVQFIKEGKIKSEGSATIEDATGNKFEQIPKIWTGLFAGKNIGKLITRVSDDLE